MKEEPIGTIGGGAGLTQSGEALIAYAGSIGTGERPFGGAQREQMT